MNKFKKKLKTTINQFKMVQVDPKPDLTILPDQL